MLKKYSISARWFVAIHFILGIALFFGSYQTKLSAIAILMLIIVCLNGRDIYMLAKSKDKISDLPKWEKEKIENYTYIEAIVLYLLSLFFLVPFIYFGLPIIKLYSEGNTISGVNIIYLSACVTFGLMSGFCAIQATNIKRILYLRNIQNRSAVKHGIGNSENKSYYD